MMMWKGRREAEAEKTSKRSAETEVARKRKIIPKYIEMEKIFGNEDGAAQNVPDGSAQDVPGDRTFGRTFRPINSAAITPHRPLPPQTDE